MLSFILNMKEKQIIKLANGAKNLMFWQVSLLQMSEQGLLNQKGEELVNKIHELISKGENFHYEMPEFLKLMKSPTSQNPFEAVKELEYIENNGLIDITWKGNVVYDCCSESFPEDEENFLFLRGLVERCRHLENIDVPLTPITTFWHWNWFEGMEKKDPYKDFFVRLRNWFFHKNGQTIIATDTLKNTNEIQLYIKTTGGEWKTKHYAGSMSDFCGYIEKDKFVSLTRSTFIAFLPFNQIMKLITKHQVPSDLIKLS